MPALHRLAKGHIGDVGAAGNRLGENPSSCRARPDLQKRLRGVFGRMVKFREGRFEAFSLKQICRVRTRYRRAVTRL